MKITTNFASAAGWTAPYLAGTSLLLAVIAGGGAMALFMSAREMQAAMPSLEARLAHYQGRQKTASVELPPDEKLAALRVRVQALNRLTGTAGLPLPTLLARLEKLAPDGVWLVSLHLQSREGETRLVVEADRAALLTQFMDRMEQSGHFSQVLLTRQAQRSEGAQTAIQFEIQLREKS